MLIAALFATALSLNGTQAPSPAESIQIPDQPELTTIIAARDTVLFTTMFDRCEPAVLADLVTDDLEFYYDRGGLTATRTAFVDGYAKSCEAAKAPDAYRSRRELVPGTIRVYAIPRVGAVEEGSHLFYERQGVGPEQLVGRARFSVLWRLEGDQWRLARAFSIDHAPASE